MNLCWRLGCGRGRRDIVPSVGKPGWLVPDGRADISKRLIRFRTFQRSSINGERMIGG